MAVGQAPLRRFPKGEAGSECAHTPEYPSLEGLVTGLDIEFPFIVLLCSLAVEPKQNSQDLSAKSPILGISNDGTEDGYDDGESEESALTNERCTLARYAFCPFPRSLSRSLPNLAAGGTITGTA